MRFLMCTTDMLKSAWRLFSGRKPVEKILAIQKKFLPWIFTEEFSPLRLFPAVSYRDIIFGDRSAFITFSSSFAPCYCGMDAKEPGRLLHQEKLSDY